MEQKELHLRLKKLRKDCKLTQEQMAKYLGVDQTLITKLENGTRAMSVTMMDQLCSLFGCTEAYLWGRAMPIFRLILLLEQMAFREKICKA